MAIYLGDKKVGVSQAATVANNKFISLVTRSISTITASDLEGATSIGDSAFAYCDGLTSITIPDSVTSIGSHAFYNCSSLISITITAVVPPTLSNVNAFQDTNSCPIYVPAASVNAYKTANTWSNLADRIEAIPEL